jgi:hypothetical protein
MTELVLTLSHEQDADWLIPLLTRLGVGVRPLVNTLSPEEEAMHLSIVEMGGEEREDFEVYLSDFQESRKDRSLPSRE